jgi:hypothetical protein
MDLRRLRDGSIDAAYVGSTLSPEQVAEEERFHLLAWVGDHLQIPTVGVAVDPVHIPLDSPALEALVRANQLALRTIAAQPRLAVDYIASFLDRLTRDEAQLHYERYIGPYFTPDGQVDLNIARRGIDAVARPNSACRLSSRRRDLSAGPVNTRTVHLTTLTNNALAGEVGVAPAKGGWSAFRTKVRGTTLPEALSVQRVTRLECTAVSHNPFPANMRSTAGTHFTDPSFRTARYSSEAQVDYGIGATKDIGIARDNLGLGTDIC